MAAKLSVKCEPDCGNAPKKLLLKEWCVALARGERARVLAVLAEDATWRIATARDPRGGEATVDQVLAALVRAGASTLEIRHILTHCAEGAIEGELAYADGARLAFCHVVSFASAKGATIRAVTTYHALAEK